MTIKLSHGYLALMLLAGACESNGQTYTFEPPSPNVGQPFTINATWTDSGNFVSSHGYVIGGAAGLPDTAGVISVWFVQDGGNFSPNPQVITASQTIGAFQVAGSYLINIIWISAGSTSQQAFNLAIGGGVPASVAINQSFTGSWYDPDEPGHGFSIEILPDSQLLAYWYVYAPPPQGGQAWVIAQGTYSGNSATLQAFWDIGSGALFPPAFNPNSIQAQQWGMITFTFTDCDNGTVSWLPSVAGYTAGSVPIKRLTTPAGLSCQ